MGRICVGHSKEYFDDTVSGWGEKRKVENASTMSIASGKEEKKSKGGTVFGVSEGENPGDWNKKTLGRKRKGLLEKDR